MAKDNYSDVMDTLLGGKEKSRILLETGTNELEILEFYIETLVGTELVKNHFGVNVAKVREVIETKGLTFTESSNNPCFRGTIPLRELILPLIDISKWLEMNKSENGEDLIIVTEFSKTVTGFIVSGVTSIHRVGWEEVMSPDKYTNSLGIQSIVGVVFIDNHITQLIDLEHIIASLNPEATGNMMQSTVKADKKYKVLIAEDSPSIGMMIKKSIEDSNMEVHLEQNGALALKYLKSKIALAEKENKDITEYVNIVISDIEMPQMDGFTFTKNVKEDPISEKLPVILYSSIITKELRHKGESVGANIQVSKPDLDQVARIAIELIEKSLPLIP